MGDEKLIIISMTVSGINDLITMLDFIELGLDIKDCFPVGDLATHGCWKSLQGRI